jgi:hypothetical protein
MKSSNKNKIYIFLIVIIISIFLLNNLYTPIQEPFIGYLNSKKNELYRNIRYKSQYSKKYLNDYFRKFKNFFQK